ALAAVVGQRVQRGELAARGQPADRAGALAAAGGAEIDVAVVSEQQRAAHVAGRILDVAGGRQRHPGNGVADGVLLLGGSRPRAGPEGQRKRYQCGKPPQMGEGLHGFTTPGVAEDYSTGPPPAGSWAGHS